MPSSLLPNFSAKPQERNDLLSLHPLGIGQRSSAGLEQVQAHSGSLGTLMQLISNYSSHMNDFRSPVDFTIHH